MTFRFLAAAALAAAPVAFAADGVIAQSRATAAADIASAGGVRKGEAAARRFDIARPNPYPHGGLVLVRDVQSGLVWSHRMVLDRPMPAEEVLQFDLRAFRFATDGQTIAGFRLIGPAIAVWSSTRRARSLSDAENALAADVTKGLAAGKAQEPDARIGLVDELGWAFLDADDNRPGSTYGLAIAGAGSERGLWFVDVRNHRGETRRVMLSAGFELLSTAAARERKSKGQ